MNMKVIFAILAGACCTLATAQTNLILNGNFEDKLPPAWTLYDFDGAETIGTLETLTQKPAEGKRAARVRRISNGTLTGMSQTLDAAPNTSYQLTLQCKAGPKSAAFAQVLFLNDADSVIGEQTSKDLDAKQWTELKLDFRTPTDTAKIRLVLGLRGNDCADFDNAVLINKTDVDKAQWGDFDARCIPVETVQAWSGKATFNTFVDSPCSLTFQFKGKYETLKAPALCLDLPAELKVVEAFQQHPGWATHLDAEKSDTEHDGAKYIRYRYLNPPFLQKLLISYGWRRMLSVLVMPPDETAAGKDYKAYWHLENNGIVGDERTFGIHFLPALPEKKMPSDFYVGFWCGYENDIPNQDVMALVLNKLQRANMTGTNILSNLKPNNGHYRQRGWQLATVVNQVDSTIQYSSLPKELQDKFADTFFAIDNKGEVNRHRMCPQFFHTNMDYRAVADERVKQSVTENFKPGDMALLDSEPWRPHEFCYCPRCIEAFKKFANIDETPNAAQIKNKYYAKWRDFRVEQCCKSIAILAGLVRKYQPQAVVCDYDYPINYDSQKDIDIFLSRCSKDARRNEAVIDGHFSSVYHILDDNFFDKVAVSKRHLKKLYFPLLAVDPPGYLAKASVLSPARFRAMLEAAAALGANGAWIYSTTVVDGSTAQGIHEAMVRIAKAEDFYKKGKRITAPLTVECDADGKTSKVRYTQYELDNQTLLTIFNYDADNGITVRLPQFKGRQILDAISEKAFTAGEHHLSVKLAPSDVRYLIVK